VYEVPGPVLVLHMDLSSQLFVVTRIDSITAITVILKAIFLDVFLGGTVGGKGLTVVAPRS